ncbi:MAG: ATP-binding cassette domain-containing protein [Acidobacteriota bacterium]
MRPLDRVVETSELSRRYGAFTAVDRVSLFVKAGEIFGLIGPNGAGKSTLIKMLTTMLPPSSGHGTVAGFDIAKHPAEVRKRIGYVPQLLSADRELTGYENLLLSARLYLIPRAERAAKIEAALAMMGLGEVRDRLARDYSGGMLRRLEIAQSTMHHPLVLFLDEPTVGLDPDGRNTVWHHVRELREQTGAAIVLTTHYMDEAEELCDRVALLNASRLAAIGTSAELCAQIGPGATLDDVFVSLTGQEIPKGEQDAHRRSLKH